MLKAQRHRLILDYINRHEFARVEDLVAISDASEITVRRDINELDALNQIKKVHGGAQRLDEQWIQSDIDVETRSQEQTEAKEEIVQRASELVCDDMVVYLDAGSTVSQLIPLLKGKKIVVYTHGVHHITNLVRHGIDCHLVGGDVKASTLACVGVETIQMLSRYKFDLAFMGANAVDESFGFSTPDVNEASVKRMIIEQSHQAVCLVDHSKFHKISKVSFADANALTIITDKVTLKNEAAFTFI